MRGEPRGVAQRVLSELWWQTEVGRVCRAVLQLEGCEASSLGSRKGSEVKVDERQNLITPPGVLQTLVEYEGLEVAEDDLVLCRRSP